jgi:hypothetical protein
LAETPEAVVVSGASPALVKVDSPPWLALLRPGLSSAGTRGVVEGAHEVLLGAVVAATVWGCGKEEEPQSGVLGVRVEGSGSTDPVKLPL